MNTDFPRRQMIEQQIRTWDVFDASVLNAFGRVERDRFVPVAWRNVAYADTEIPLPHGQVMLRPSIVGRLLQALEIQSGDNVLDVGTGTGYLAACLAQVARKVTSIDLFDDFVALAMNNLADADVKKVSVKCMDVTQELPAGQFDAIAVTGSVAELDRRWVTALKPGGRLFIVVGNSPAKSAMLLKRRPDDTLETTELFETDIPALVTRSKPATFCF
jgi:protein-L-isoaspartate(D-aspartate) O-methyltransferase